MKKILLILMVTMGLKADFVSVDCNAFNEIYLQMQGISKKCEVSTDVHTFTQEIDKNTSGIIRYENGEEIPINVVNNKFSINIEQDRKFTFKVGDYESVLLKLSILSNGNESWKFFYEPTKRWRKYDFAKITITKYPQIVHSGTQGQPVEVYSRIVDAENNPIPYVEVRLIGDSGWSYLDKTDNDGKFSFNVTDRDAFTLQAWNPKTSEWASYDNKLSINSFNNLFVKVNNVWHHIQKIDEKIITQGN